MTNDWLDGLLGAFRLRDQSRADRDAFNAMPDPAIRDALLRLGWTVERASLYDEDGIEGWQWVATDGREYHTIGDWNDAPTPPRCDAARRVVLG